MPEPLPFRDFVAQARLGVSREEHERYFTELLGDVEETTAPFGLLDVHGDGSGIQRRPAGRSMRTSPSGCAWLARERGVSPGDDLPPRLGARAGRRLRARRRRVRHRAARPDERGRRRRPGAGTVHQYPAGAGGRVGEANVEDALTGLRDQLAELLVHEHAPLTLAQQVSGVPGGNPLFTSLFNFRHNRSADSARADR